MTTAARPTFDPARGGRGKGEGDLSAMSKQYSSRDMPSHTKLKYRQSGQSTSEELQSREFRHELEEKEHQSRQKRERDKGRSFTEAPALTSSSGSSGTKKPRVEHQQPPVSLDADDPLDEDNEDEDDDDSDEDDTAELLMELQKIRKERMEDQDKRDRERKEEEERIRTENLLKGNPLLNQSQIGSFKIKKRWDDDVVFKNCAKIESRNKEKTFVNDTIRSEFHRKFMDKYIK